MRSTFVTTALTVVLTRAAADTLNARDLAPIKCPADDGKIVTTPNGSVFQVECATDHVGGNLPNSLVYVPAGDLAACISACSTTIGCIDVSLSGSACYRKGSVGRRLSSPGINGGLLLSLGTAAPTISTSSSTTSSAAPPPSTGVVGPLYACPAGNNTLYQSGSIIFQIQCGIDHVGGNLQSGSLTYPGGGLKGCADRCAATVGCVDVSLSGAACYLKGSVGRQLVDPGVNGALSVGTVASTASSSPVSMSVSRSSVALSMASSKSQSSASASASSSSSSATPSKSVSTPSASPSKVLSTPSASASSAPSSLPSSTRSTPALSASAPASTLSSPFRSSSRAPSFASVSSGAVCPSRTVSSYASALSTNSAARDQCASSYPQSSYATSTASYFAPFYPFTTTSITCTPKSGLASSTPARKKRTVVSSASQPSRSASSSLPPIASSKPSLSTPSKSIGPLSTPSGSLPSSASKPPSSIYSPSKPPPSISSAPQSTPTTSDPLQGFTQLPPACFSSVCSALAGITPTVTTYYNTATTQSLVVSTIYSAAPESCVEPQDYCDTTHDQPVCRPEPIINACTSGPLDGHGGYFTPACTSTNGCSGNCFLGYEAIPKNSTVTGNYTTNPDGFYNGQCVLGSDNYFFVSPNFNLACATDHDCGRGAVCVLLEFGFRCLLAASETCNPGQGYSLSGNGLSLQN